MSCSCLPGHVIISDAATVVAAEVGGWDRSVTLGWTAKGGVAKNFTPRWTSMARVMLINIEFTPHHSMKTAHTKS
jgi:hypothetical protein